MMAKFLLYGNAPNQKTGYGIQLAYLGEMLRQDGHEVAYVSTYGLQGGVSEWNGFRVYGSGFDSNCNDVIHMHASHWFRNDPDCWIITLIDVWILKNPLLADFNVLAWVPIDHETDYGPQRNVLEFFNMSGAVPVAMAPFGQRLLSQANLNPAYIPLTVDTSVYMPTPELPNGQNTREFMGIPEDAFLVSLVGMNKGWAKDRKGFNEAFWAFGLFDAMHPEANAHLYIHAEQTNIMDGMDLKEMAIGCRVQPHKITFGGGPNQYGLRLGYTPEMMAAMYTTTDVLLAPSHGEGFCVPIIEAQACGTPAIVNDFSAQQDLVDDEVGWKAVGQPEWDPVHQARYQQPLIIDIVDRLVDAFEADREKIAEACVARAREFDTRVVYERDWRPLIADLTREAIKPELEREPMPEKNAVAVIVPIKGRTEHIVPLAESFARTTNESEASLWFILDHGDRAASDECEKANDKYNGIHWIFSDASTCAEKWNYGFDLTSVEPWVFCTGDDVRFHEGWLDEARKWSSEFDVIGTNDTTGKVKNPFVARGIHADHFFVRRAYVEEYGACLDGPGVLAPECYRHWYTDTEIIKLARARGVFTPCLTSVVEHLHEGYDGLTMEDRLADPLLKIPVEAQPQDQQTWLSRMPLVEQQRTTRGKI